MFVAIFLWQLLGRFSNNNNNNNNNNNKLAKERYIKRHDTVSAQLHFNICKETGVQLDKKHR